ncbi:hypothetical protein NE237_006953 [Protea cynaroides]|uniref:Uncharacterized protein n=1 Tax=Protea cynaroides TaxID=273540 RepID=A0A9Q0KP53_9MAGN|nr:hypothetical protein NE237_006953 [Protea cynaroides]
MLLCLTENRGFLGWEFHVRELVKVLNMDEGRSSKGLGKSCILLIVISGVERLAFKGVASNLITYLTDVVNMGNSSAAKTVNNWCGVTSILSLLGALVADSYWDRYSTILASSILYVVGLAALTSTALLRARITLPEKNSDRVELELEERPLCNQDFESLKTMNENPNNEIVKFDVRRLLRLLPIWITLLMFAVVFQQPATFFTKQGMTMKRSIGSSFVIPPATLQSAITISIVLLMPLYDKMIIPFIQIITRTDKGINVMQRMGIGMVLSVAAMAIAAIVETKRLKIGKSGIFDSQSETVPMTIFWLLPQYILLGISDVFTVVGMQEFFYTQMPSRMRTMGIALYLSVFGIGSFLSALLISLIEIVTCKSGQRQSWFSDDLREARLDNYYWLLALLSALSFLVFMCLCKFYNGRNTSATVNCK